MKVLEASFRQKVDECTVLVQHMGSFAQKRVDGHRGVLDSLGVDLELDAGEVPVAIFRTLLRNAPSLSAGAFLLQACKDMAHGEFVRPLFSSSRHEHTNVPSAIHELVKKIDLSSRLVNVEDEVEALIRIVRLAPSQKVAADLLQQVLNMDSFQPGVSLRMVELLGTVLIDCPCLRPKSKSKMGSYGMGAMDVDIDFDLSGGDIGRGDQQHRYGSIPDNDSTRQLKSAAVTWLTRITGHSSFKPDPSSMEAVGWGELSAMKGAIKLWGQQMASLDLKFNDVKLGYPSAASRPDFSRALGIDSRMDVADDSGPRAGVDVDDVGNNDDEDGGGGEANDDHHAERRTVNDERRPLPHERGRSGGESRGRRGGERGGDTRKLREQMLPSDTNRSRFRLDAWSWLAAAHFEELSRGEALEHTVGNLQELCAAVDAEQPSLDWSLALGLALADGVGASAARANDSVGVASIVLSIDGDGAVFGEVTHGILFHVVEARQLMEDGGVHYGSAIADARFWGVCLKWHQTTHNAGRIKETKALPLLVDKFSAVRDLFTDVSKQVLDCVVNVSTLRGLLKSNEDLDVIWQVINSPLRTDAAAGAGKSGIAVMNDDLVEYHRIATNLNTVLNALMADEADAARLQELLDPRRWDELTLADIRYLLGAQKKAGPQNIAPLPSTLVASVDWFLSCVEQRSLFQTFFTTLWDRTVDGISRVIDLWVAFYLRCATDRATFDELDKFGSILLDAPEVDTFVRSATRRIDAARGGSTSSASSSSSEDEGSYSPDRVLVISKVIRQWWGLRHICGNEQKCRAVIDSAAAHVVASVRPELTAMKETLQNLCIAVRSNGPWGQQTTALLATYWAKNKAGEIDPRIVDISDALVTATTAHAALMRWLRSQVDDDGFTHRVEYARGLQEMNTPIELWDAVHARVNEKFLSMLRNVRSYLHAFLYSAKPEIESINDFINVFTNMNSKTDVSVICKNVIECGKPAILKALQQVVGSSAEKAGLSRLVRLYDTDCHSMWICRSTDAADGSACAATSMGGIGGAAMKSSVSLRFSVEPVAVDDDGVDAVVAAMDTSDVATLDATRPETWRFHSYQELLDFQSGIVLDRNLSEDAETLRDLVHDQEKSAEDVVVDTFLNQFSWIRRLGEALEKLHEAGHFSYFPTYSKELSVNLPDAAYRSVVEALEAELASWLTCVKEVRLTSYFANFFDLKRFYGLKLLLEGATSPVQLQVSEAHALVAAMSDYICFVNPDKAFDLTMQRDIAGRLLQSWQAGQSQHVARSKADWTSEEVLSLIALSVDTAFAHVPRRFRAIILDSLDTTVVADRLKRGIYVVQAASSKEEFDQCITLNAIHGGFPEWENCLICSLETSWEDVLLLILRWHGAWSKGRAGVLYGLVDVEALSYGEFYIRSQAQTKQ